MNRPLSAGEHLLWLIDQAVAQNFVMAARLSPLSGRLTHLPSLLRQALDILRQRYPSLNCRIKKGKAPGFITDNVPKIPLRIIRRKGNAQTFILDQRSHGTACPDGIAKSIDCWPKERARQMVESAMRRLKNA